MAAAAPAAGAATGSSFAGTATGVGTGLGGLAKAIPAFFGQRTPVGQQQQLQVRPQELALLEAQRGRVAGQTEQQVNLLRNLQQAALGAAPTLAPIQAPQFGQELDPFARALASRGEQALGQRGAAARQQIARQFRGQPGVSQALQAQAGAAAQLAANPLLLQAAQEQAGRELGQGQLRLASAEAANRALLQEAAAGAAARGEAAGFGQQALGAQQNLLAGLSGLAQLLGTQLTGAQRDPRTGKIKQDKTGGIV